MIGEMTIERNLVLSFDNSILEIESDNIMVTFPKELTKEEYDKEILQQIELKKEIKRWTKEESKKEEE